MVAHAYPHLGFDPAPGDPASVREVVATVSRVVGGGDSARRELNGLGSSDAVWAGKAAEAFRELFAELPPYLTKALTSLDDARRALTEWESQLDGFQSRARRLEEEAAEAARRAGSARSAVRLLPGRGTGEDTRTAGEREKDEKDAKDRKRELREAEDALSEVRDRAHALNGEYVVAAATASRLVRNAADDAPPEPGWFDKALDFLGGLASDVWDVVSDPEVWKLIGDVLADIALVVGVLAIFVSGLGMLAFVLCVGALAFHLAAKAGGADVSWETIAWDAVGVVAGGISLGGAALAKSGRALVVAGRELRLSSGLMATLGKIGRGNLFSGLARIPSGMANSARGLATAGKGWAFVKAGNAVDSAATWAGAALGIGSNMHSGTIGDGRWTDGRWEPGDAPVVGPFVNYFRPAEETTPGAAAPSRPVLDTGATLTSAGTTFASHLDPSSLGAAA
ncbi:WXG100 family type VII secretion target [Streptomyces sp. NPDC007088]|uniref:WXG100 family type VII secretion target n=1 Tax=Streptomyces sp. NPDC007088 TaxID=3364773 RepID=UPI0036B9A516